ncbi:GH25 family lysozyme, partial [Furfurilactobacillus entadae]|uniref:GH25 family lysozyme n=1 Tax=Furfurilactobacillus entadae TaxID=2922307 RepID=UPI0038B32492
MLNVIDVASYQDGIDLTQVPSDVVIIKATDGTNYVNPACNAQYASAKAAGKRMGLYHFAEPGTDAVTQARFFVDNVKNYLLDEHALPMLDWEADAINLGPAWASQWLDEVARLTGASPMIYMSKATTNQYDWSPVARYYALWGAQYASSAPQYGFIADPWTDDNAWGAWGVPTVFQYSSTGRLSGWNGSLDLSMAYLDGDGWDKFTNAGGNGQKVDPTP